MAILIDRDMPEECGKCCFLDIDVFLNNDCILEDRNPFSDTMDLSRGRPYWCPLREVVRCKDCIYWVPDQVGVVEQPYCTRLGFEELSGLDLRIGSAEHFCCFGERREE